LNILYKAIIIALAFPAILLSDTGILSRIVDGDTVYFGEVKCRLSYIDTPESQFNDKAERDASKCAGMTVELMVNAGREASRFTESQLQLGMSYKYQVVAIDRYERSVCLIESSSDNNLNLLIVNAGFAVPYKQYIPDDGIKIKYAEAVREAKQNNLGLWKSHPNVMQCMEATR
jgi:endonuclease YncB( thermonuclease family)